MSVYYRQSATACIAVLGQPSGIEERYSEVDNTTMKVYHYSSNNLYFIRNKLVGYQIRDTSISVGRVKGNSFKISDKIANTLDGAVMDPTRRTLDNTSFSKSFYNFPVSETPGESRNIMYNKSSLIFLNDGNVPCDCFVELLFDSNGELFDITLTEP